jgi:enoyl-CoA hydratase
MSCQALTYAVAGRVATITLERPGRMNAINLRMPGEIGDAVERASRDDAVHVIVLTGAGDGHPWGPMADYFGMYEFTRQFMSLWRSYKPTIAKVHGPAVAGGSDIALCCDLVDGREAARLGLVLGAVPRSRLDARVAEIAARIAAVPKNQLMMQKLMVNQAYDAMGPANTQRFATLFDGITRHSPAGVWFKQRAEEVGFQPAVRERDGGAPIAAEASRPLAPWPRDVD